MYNNRLKATYISLFIACFLMLGNTGVVEASAPHRISYQGRLTEPTGAPVVDGVYTITFNIYDAYVGGVAKWSSVRIVDVTDGLLEVALGDSTLIPDSVFNGNSPRYLGITIGSDVEISPRVPLISSPYSYHALTSDSANSAHYADTAGYALSVATGPGAWVLNGTIVSLATAIDSVGIGTNTPGTKLDVAGGLNVSGTASFGTANLVQGVGAIVVGANDTTIGEGASVTGGQANSAIGDGAHIGGGFTNKASITIATIGGGANNEASDTAATVAGGAFNRALGLFSFVGGGGGSTPDFGNSAESDGDVVVGGTQNSAQGSYSVVVGGKNDTAVGYNSFIGGGAYNKALASYSTVGGGSGNKAGGQFSTVSGGALNHASGDYSIIAGGGGPLPSDTNSATGERSTIGGGSGNYALGFLSTISGGSGNTATGPGATIGGGDANIAADTGAVVSGGLGNRARGKYSVVAGGGGPTPADSNSAGGDWSTVGGGFDNSSPGSGSAIAGGYHNRADSAYSFVGGGNSNRAAQRGAAVGGGEGNYATGFMSTIVGGQGSNASGDYSFIGGGNTNQALGEHSVVVGGGGSLSWELNRALGLYATIGGGLGNTVDSSYASILGGIQNYASDFSFVGGGYTDSAFGGYSVVSGGVNNTASGWSSTIPGGKTNRAAGRFSFAAGHRAIAAHDGAFVWADSVDADFSSVQSNEFAIRAGNGLRIEANSISYGSMLNNSGNGDGLRIYSNVSRGVGWGAIYATNSGSSPTMSIWRGTGKAAFFSGDVDITGTLSKGGGSFKIDHPLDPGNKYLYHSFVESPDMMNIYNGNVILDAKGEATVTMPNYFEALNRDYRYQLTCIGGYAPVYIASEIQNNSFRISGGSAGLKVSWTVTGVRQDAWANAHRIPVEVSKSNTERGKYLYPKELGKSVSTSVMSNVKQ